MSRDNRNIRDTRYIKHSIYQEISGITRISMHIMYMGDIKDIKDVKGY